MKIIRVKRYFNWLTYLIQSVCWSFAFGALAPGAHALDALSKSVQTSGGKYSVEMIAPHPIPVNEICSLRFKISDSKNLPVKDARISARAWMPAHGHGTALQPEFSVVGDGEIIGEGFLFQMEGKWELEVSVFANGKLERASFILDLAYD